MEVMKDSGLKWIGVTPSDWKITRIKYMSSLKGRIGWQGLTSEEYQDDGAYLITGVDFLDGGIDWENCVHVPMKRWEEAKDIQIQNGDLLITKDGTIGKVAIVSDMPGETSLNSGVLRIMPFEGYSRRFLYWVLQSDEFWNWFNYKNAGNSTIVHLYQGDFAEFYYTFPDYQEQRRIADYLDKHCAKLDKIIANLERQIELLQKYKKSLITETVTKGLNKNVEMKDSGIAWVGAIPKDWTITKVKYLCNMRSGDNLVSEDIQEDGDYPVYGGNGVRGYFDHFTNDGMYPVIGRQGALAGNVHIVDGKFWATDHAVVVYCHDNFDKMFAYYLFQAMNLNQYAYETAAQPGLAVIKLLNLKCCVPADMNIQKKIATFLNEKCSVANNMIQRKESMLQILTKCKASFIYEYATGKKHVRGAK